MQWQHLKEMKEQLSCNLSIWKRSRIASVLIFPRLRANLPSTSTSIAFIMLQANVADVPAKLKLQMSSLFPPSPSTRAFSPWKLATIFLFPFSHSSRITCSWNDSEKVEFVKEIGIYYFWAFTFSRETEVRIFGEVLKEIIQFFDKI